MDKLRVRAYNVRFGDAILVSVPEKTKSGAKSMKHIFIDFGNVLAGGGGQDDVFGPIIKNVVEVLGGKPLDLYVMTHEHMDHIQGLPYCSRNFFTGDKKLRDTLKARYAWITGSSGDGYYEKHPKAKKKKELFLSLYNQIQSYLNAAGGDFGSKVDILMANNNPRSTQDCVNYLKRLSQKPSFIHREFKVKGHHPFKEAKFEIWAPEEDTSEYYSKHSPMALGAFGGEQLDSVGQGGVPELLPPRGVDAGAFYELVESRRQFLGNLLAIDKAANNTSIVFKLSWRDWNLLFTGDAEERSWALMQEKKVLKPVHFLKIGHHGSHNGTPGDDLLDVILPKTRSDRRKRVALVSTWEDTYGGIPHEPTLNDVAERCDDVIQVHKKTKPGEFVDIEFPASGNKYSVTYP
ncbi:MAG: hypothetical protein WEA61_04145 [Anaerolineales bacterium]